MHVFSEYSHSLWIEDGDPNKLIVSFTYYAYAQSCPIRRFFIRL
jgi:hypothetical protein